MPKIADFYAELGLDKTKFDRGMSDAGKSPGKLGELFKGLAAGIASAFSVAAIATFTKQSIAAYNVQATGEAALLKALNGRVDVQQKLLAQAADLQTKTLFDDDATSAAMKQLAVFKLTEKEISNLIPLIQDFATVNKMDLDSAAKLVGKSVGTSTNALARYGVAISDTMTKAERAAEVQRIFNERYGGQAEVAASVGTGAMTKLSNAFGDFQEIVGKVLVQNTSGYIDDITQSLSDLNKQLGSDVLSGWDKFFSIMSKLVALNDPTGMMSPSINALTNSKIKEHELDQKLITAKQTLNNLRANAKSLIADEAARLREKAKERAAEIAEEKRVAAEKIAIAKDMANKLENVRQELINAPGSTVGDNLFQFDPNNVDMSMFENMDIEPIKIPVDIESFNTQMEEAKQRTLAFTTEMSKLMEDFMADFVSTFAQGIGDLITGNQTLKGFFQSILNSIGEFITQMGEAMIAYGIGVIALEMAFSNPYAAIVAGAALVAIGTVISNLAAKGPDVSGSTGGMAGSSYENPAYQKGIIGANGEMILTTSVSGDDLLLILQRAENNRLRTRG